MHNLSLYQAGYEYVIWLYSRQVINVQSGTILDRASMYSIRHGMNMYYVTILGREQTVRMYNLSLYQAGYEYVTWLYIRQGIKIQSGTILGRVSIYSMALYQAGYQCIVCHYIRQGINVSSGTILGKVLMQCLSLYQAGY